MHWADRLGAQNPSLKSISRTFADKQAKGRTVSHLRTRGSGQTETGTRVTRRRRQRLLLRFLETKTHEAKQMDQSQDLWAMDCGEQGNH